MPVLGGIQTSPILYEIDQRGADLLRAEFGYSSKELRSSGGKISGFRFLEHTIGLSEIRVAVNLSCRRNGYALNTWLDEKTLKGDYDRVRVGNEWLAVIPDGYFVVELPGGAAHFFIEFDRGPERLEVFRKKIAAYLAYYRSGQCKLRYKTDRIRVLTITQAAPTGPGKQRIETFSSCAATAPPMSEAESATARPTPMLRLVVPILIGGIAPFSVGGTRARRRCLCPRLLQAFPGMPGPMGSLMVPPASTASRAVGPVRRIGQTTEYRCQSPGTPLS